MRELRNKLYDFFHRKAALFLDLLAIIIYILPPYIITNEQLGKKSMKLLKSI